MLESGDPAPEVTARNQHGESITPDFADPTVVYFYLFRGENPALQGGSESDNPSTIHRRWQTGYSTPFHTIK